MRKRRMLLSFATAMFILLGNLQFSYADDVKITREVVDLDEGEKVPYGLTKEIAYKQNQPVKLDITPKDKDIVILLDSSKKDSEDEGKPDSPFSYALFAGSEVVDDALTMYGDYLDIDGDSHSNGNIYGYVGETSKLDGDFTAYGSVNVSGNNVSVTVGSEQNIIAMPDLSDKFAVDAKKNQSYFSTSYDTETGKRWYEYNVEDSEGTVKSKFGVGLKCSYSDGTWDLVGEELILDRQIPLLFDGNVKFSLDNISGSGFIIATGGILFNNGNATDLGLKYNSDGTVDLENSAEIGFYSINGNIDFNMAGGAKFKGLVYAPKGNLQLNSDVFHLYGSLVANTLVLGGDKLVHYVRTDLHKDIDEGGSNEDIQYFNAQESAIKIIEGLGNYSGSDINLATIMYSDKAYKLGTGFYQIDNNAEGVTTLKQLVSAYETKEGVNMAEGLKLASETLKNSDTDREKYLIVLSYNEPNRYTNDDGDIKTDAALALEYAEKVAEQIKDENFDNIYLVDVNSNATLTCIKKIGSKIGAKSEFIFNPSAVMSSGTAEKSFESSLNDVLNSILKDIKFIPEVKKVEVSFNTSDKPHKLPDGVTFVPNKVKREEVNEETGEMISVEDDKSSFDFISATRELKLKEGNYSIDLSQGITNPKIEDLTMSVKFNKRTDSDTISTDPVLFEKTELIYTFTLSSKSGVDETVSISVPVEELKVEVEFKKDIN